MHFYSGPPMHFVSGVDNPFVRLDWVARDRFDIQWYRHTGVWHCLYRGLPLTEAFNPIETDGILHPV